MASDAENLLGGSFERLLASYERGKQSSTPPANGTQSNPAGTVASGNIGGVKTGLTAFGSTSRLPTLRPC